MSPRFRPVNARRWILLCILAALQLAGDARAVTPSRNATDYDGVLQRNPFKLRPPDPPAPPPKPPEAPPSNLELTGLSTAFGHQTAYMNVKNPKGAVAESFTVGEPPKEGIQVLSLNISTGEVRVSNRGVESVLSLDKNGAKPPVGPAPVAPTPMPATGIRPLGIQQPQPQPGADGMPTGIGTPTAPGTTPAVIPTRSIRVPAVPQQPTTDVKLTPEVEAQMVLMEINRLQQQQSGQSGPPLPPTPLAPAQ